MIPLKLRGNRTARAAAILLLAGTLATTVTCAQGLALLKGGAQPAPAAASRVPDPATLKPGWWDYIAPATPGLQARITSVLDQAGTRAASLPAPSATAAGQALERLRISLSALPAMLAAQPATLPDMPSAQDRYTTTEILQIDRDIRDLQDDLDERRSNINAADRAIKDGQRRGDSAFAAYLADKSAAPARTRAGLQIMATQAEVAVTQAEMALRKAEAELLTGRIRAMTALRDAGSNRIVPDPKRPPAKIRALLARYQASLEEQRSEILRTRAQRGELASRADTTTSRVSLADLRILAAVIDEGITATRIELYRTELDWLTISAGTLAPAAAAEIDSGLQQRRGALDLMDRDADEWVAAIGRLINSSLRTRSDIPVNGDSEITDQMVELGRTTITRINRLRSLQGDVRFAIGVTTDQLAAASGWRGWLRTRVEKPGMVLMSRTDDLLATSLFRIGDAPVTAYGLLRVVLIMIMAVLLSRVVRHLLARFGNRRPGSASAGFYTIGRLLHYVLITAGLMIGLSSIGLDFSQLALVAGALSIGVGFGLQSIVNNFVSGLMILFEQSLKIGDVVELDSGVRGAVREIRVRSTLITTSDGVDIIVPNSEFVSGKVINFTLREPYHRIHVPFGVAYTSDKDQVRAIVIEAARAVTFTHMASGREPDVWLVKFGDNSLDFELVVWINPVAVTRAGAVMATYLWEIESALKRNGVEIPFPQRDVHLRVSASELESLRPAGNAPAPPG